jgi:CheY-specific phosphatase CheX
MRDTKALKTMPGFIRDWVEEILGFLLKSPLPAGGVRLAEGAGPESGPEIGLVVQFWGGGEGEIVLLASRRTARAFLDRLGRAPAAAPGGPEEMKLIKSSLGELLNVLSAKLLSAYAERGRPQRLTTPSCIFGKELVIIPEDGETATVAVDTPFGRLDFHVRLGP